MVESITLKARAKINLTLDILGKRPDGYHELSTVMQSLELYDTLVIKTIEKQGLDDIILETDCPTLPTDENNLVYKAARLILKEHNVQQGVHIYLHKRIPLAAGLAGGSSDCAATLWGLNTLLGLNVANERLFEMGRQLGADVPFCLFANFINNHGTALAEGIGEKLTPLPLHPDVWILLARLPIEVSTQEIFSRFGAMQPLPIERTPSMLEALETQKLPLICFCLGNGLTDIAVSMHPEIHTLITLLQGQEALGVNMTGSGPTVFAYFPSKSAACSAVNALESQAKLDIFLTKPQGI